MTTLTNQKKHISKGEIEIFKTEKGTEINVQLDNNTVWLDAHLIAALFNVQRPAIVKHIGNIYKAAELDRGSTCSKMEQVAADGKRRKMNLYNLDVIISVGYRVNSKEATRFRQWANKILKDYLVKGYAINERRLAQKREQLFELQKVVALQSEILKRKKLSETEAVGLLKVIGGYSKALDLLDDYDHQRLELKTNEAKTAYKITYTEARAAIDELGRQTKFEGLFGREKDDSFKGSLENIFQTFDGKDLYPSIEEKAAHLLYFVVKNHSFTDGNKRIAAFLFIWFLDLNHLLFDENGFKKMADETLVALTLMIAESHSGDKDMMVKVIVNLL